MDDGGEAKGYHYGHFFTKIILSSSCQHVQVVCEENALDDYNF